jgi:hypothetical protein
LIQNLGPLPQGGCDPSGWLIPEIRDRDKRFHTEFNSVARPFPRTGNIAGPDESQRCHAPDKAAPAGRVDDPLNIPGLSAGLQVLLLAETFISHLCSPPATTSRTSFADGHSL